MPLANFRSILFDFKPHRGDTFYLIIQNTVCSKVINQGNSSCDNKCNNIFSPKFFWYNAPIQSRTKGCWKVTCRHMFSKIIKWFYYLLLSCINALIFNRPQNYTRLIRYTILICKDYSLLEINYLNHTLNAWIKITSKVIKLYFTKRRP